MHARASGFAKRDLSILISAAAVPTEEKTQGTLCFRTTPPALFHAPVTFIPPFRCTRMLSVHPDPSLSRKKGD